VRHLLGFHDGEYFDGDISGLGAVFGLRKMGKTTEVIRLANQCKGTVVFWDYTGQHGGMVHGANNISQPGQLKSLLLARSKRRRLAIRYVPTDRTFVDHFRAMCGICFEAGDLILIADEVDACCGEQWGQHRMPPELYEIAHMGRHGHVSMLATARDAPTISKNFRSQCDNMRLFRVSEEDHVEYFAKKIGRKNAALLPYLPPWHYLYWESGMPGVRLMKSGKEVAGIEHVLARAKQG
jgi:hypothetical protein